MKWRIKRDYTADAWMYAIHFSAGAKLPSFPWPDGNITSLRLTDYSVQSHILEWREGSCLSRSCSLSVYLSSSKPISFSYALAPCCSFKAQHDLLSCRSKPNMTCWPISESIIFTKCLCVSVSWGKVWTGHFNTPFCFHTILKLQGNSTNSWNIIWDKSRRFGSVMKWDIMHLSHVVPAWQSRD